MKMPPAPEWNPDFHYPQKSSDGRRRSERFFRLVCTSVSGISLLILITLVTAILFQGLPRIIGSATEGFKFDFSFMLSMPSSDPEKAGIFLALCGTIWVCVTCAIVTMPLGVATAIFLEEYQPKNRYLGVIHRWFELLISNLAGVPSIVYGLVGLTVFVYMFGLLGTVNRPNFEIGSSYYHQYLSLDRKRTLRIPAASSESTPPKLVSGMNVLTADGRTVKLNVLESGQARPKDPELLRRSLKQNSKSSVTKEKSWYYMQLPLGYSVLAGSLTLMLVVLPVVIISSQEALRAVPSSLRDGGLGMGCTPWQVVWNITLPSATPGIMTGSILAMSRAMGEAAPILLVSSALYVSNVPSSLMSRYTIMPLQIYQWADDHNRDFYSLAATGIIVLLVVLLIFNSIAVFVRQRSQKKIR